MAQIDEQGRGATLRMAVALTCLILVVEFAGGLISHSLALLADAGHVLADVFALGLAWLVNSVTLVIIVIAIAYEAVRRLASPEPVQGAVVIVTALTGIAVNLFVIFGLRGENKSLNMRAAFLH